MIQPTEIIVTDEVVKWFKRRNDALKAAAICESKLQEIQAIQRKENPTHPKYRSLLPVSEGGKAFEARGFNFKEIDTKSKRSYPCHCGRVFEFYLERETHVSEGRDGCGRDGELVDGIKKAVIRNEGIKGNPVVKIKTAKNGIVPQDFDF